MALLAPLINGHRFSFASIEIVAQIGATKTGVFIDVDEITYSESLVIEFRRGTSRVPIGSTSGIWEPQECSMSMGKSTFNEMVTQVGPGWLGINLLMNVSYVDILETPAIDTIVGRIIGAEDAHTYGPEALKTVLKFMPITPILRNGVPSMLNRVI
jgi:hypothetical protein